MSKIIGKLIGVAVVAAGAYVVGKYLHDYTDYKAAKDEDLEGIRQGGSDVKNAAKRTYVAIREKNDVKAPVTELGQAIGEVATGTGKLIGAVGVNTAEFVKGEKEKYDLDPKAYREEVADNFKDMGQQAVNTLNNIKEDAIDVAFDIKNAAENLAHKKDEIIESEYVAEENKKESGVVISEDTEKLN